MMTQDQARAVLEGMVRDKRAHAASCRQSGEACQRAAGNTDDQQLRRYQFEESTRWIGQARSFDFEAEAIEIVLSERSDR